MSESHRTLGHALSASAAGAALLERLAASRRIASIFANDPHLKTAGVDVDRPGLFDLRDVKLRLNARSPSQAAKLRQSLPHLHRILSHHGFDGIELEVGIQPALNAYPESASSENSLESAPENCEALASRRERIAGMMPFFEQLAHTLENPHLRTVAERLRDGMAIRLAETRERKNPR